MTRIEALRSAINTLTDRSNQLRAALQEYATRDGDPTDEERTQFKADVDEFDAAGPELERLNAELRQLEAIADAPERARVAGAPTMIVRGKQSGSMELGNEFRSPDEVRSLALAAAERDMVEVEDWQRENLAGQLRKYDSPDGKLSRHVLAHSRPEYRSAFAKLMTASVRGIPARLDDAEHQAVEFARAVTITSGSAGTAIPTPLDPTLILTGAHNGYGNVWRQICRNVQTMSNTWNGVSTAGITVGYGAEAEEASDNSPTMTAIAMTLYRGRGLVPFSIESEQDWSGMQSEMMNLFQVAKDDNDDSVFSSISAAAANTPSGFPYLLVTNFSGQVVASAGSNTFTVADLSTVRFTLPRRFRNSAVWLGGPLTYSKIRQFTDSTGLWSPGLADGEPERLLSHSWYESPGIDQTFGSGENYILFFGDLSQAFIIGDRLGTTVELIPHLVGGSNNFPTGERGLFMNWRTGTQIGNQSAVQALNIT